MSSIFWPARWLASLKIVEWIERDKSSACKACGLASATSAASKAAILSAKFACAAASASALVSTIPASRPAIIPSALPRSNAAATVSKFAAFGVSSAASPSPLSAIKSFSTASLANGLFASASLARLTLAPEGWSSETLSGVTFEAASLIGNGELSGDAVSPRGSLAPSADIKAPPSSQLTTVS